MEDDAGSADGSGVGGLDPAGDVDGLCGGGSREDAEDGEDGEDSDLSTMD
jgi:hypothetical protein